MAQKKSLNVFGKTDDAGYDMSELGKEEPGNYIRQTGVGLRTREIEALDQIGAELGGISRNALIRFATRKLIKEYRIGELDLSAFVTTPPEPKKKLEMPD